MRRVLFVVLLAVLTAVGCSRQSPPHVGGWDGAGYLDGKRSEESSTFSFSEDGTAKVISDGTSSRVMEGKYKFDYSKKPVQLDINWSDNSVMRGIVRFIGKDKSQMQINYALGDNPNRPQDFEVKEPFFWLTKKVEK